MRWTIYPALVLAAALPCAAAVDTNGDGLDDVWQSRYGADAIDADADDDGDGLSNRDESLGGTDPFDPASALIAGATKLDPLAATLELGWPGEAGKLYVVEVSADPASGGWVAVTAPAATASAALATAAIPELAGDLGFVRVVPVDADADGDGLSHWAELQFGWSDGDHAANGSVAGDFAAALGILSGSAPFTLGGATATRIPQTPETAARLLAQATLGADWETIQTVSTMGLEEWLQQQFAQPIGLHQPFVDARIAQGLDTWAQHRRWAWWEQVMISPDLLRQRVAMALSEIMVVSEFSQPIADNPDGAANYWDTLLDHSFGNFRDLLLDVTLHPCMGVYLSHLRNRKSDPSIGRYPDENYAREVMQLFTIGLYELEPDGSQTLDAQNDPIPTYDNGDITEMAKVFTGLAFGGPEPHFQWGQAIYTTPMIMFENEHESGPKQLLRGETIPDGQSGMQDVEQAIDNLFNHPNVGPFIGRRLIQRLVTSNPSPAYIRRVTRAFDDDGAGVRGNMQAVLRAVLLDPEARNLDRIDDPHHGMQREPFLRRVHLARAFNAANAYGTFPISDWDAPTVFGQRPLSSPSVFNFFQPDYQPAGAIADAGLYAPEFQITTSVTTIAGDNEMRTAMDYTLNWDDDLANRVTLDMSDELAIADDPDALVDRLDLLLTYGNLSDATWTLVRDTIAQRSDLESRVRMAIYLIVTSPDYVILK